MIRYQNPQGVKMQEIKGRPILTTPEGGSIAIDKALLSLWKVSDGKLSEDIQNQLKGQQFDPFEVQVALGCLAEAGLLHRDENLRDEDLFGKFQGPLISVIIVSHNSRDWLEMSLPSLETQTYSPLEVIVVDNASLDDSSEWVAEKYPDYKLLSLQETVSLAKAINQGVDSAEGEYCLILNPDVKLKQDAVEKMLKVAQEDQSCAAVAAKLRFLWAPAFLNGVGNSVGAISWGQDNGLGHLDLGQFDSWTEVPSACFAAALISMNAWRKIGPSDENFPLYYEDSEWSYRARILGYSIRLAPSAVVYHAFGGRKPAGKEDELSAKKLRQVNYGRLRFITKILGRNYLLRYLINYMVEDFVRLIWAVLRGRFEIPRAVLLGWQDYLNKLPEIRYERRLLQSKRVLDDDELMRLQQRVPMPLIWHGLPELTMDAVRTSYMPLINSGQGKRIPEIFDNQVNQSIESSPGKLSGTIARMKKILDAEGINGLLNQYLRHLQWILR